MDENLESTVQNAWYACGGQEDGLSVPDAPHTITRHIVLNRSS